MGNTAKSKLHVMGETTTAPSPVKRASRKPAPTKTERAAAAHMLKFKQRLCYGLAGMALMGLGLSGYDSYHAIMQFGRGHVQWLQAGALAVIIDGLLAGSKFGMLFASQAITKRWALAFVIIAGAASVILNFLEFASTYTWLSGSWLGHGMLGALVPTLVLVAFNFIGHLWQECQ